MTECTQPQGDQLSVGVSGGTESLAGRPHVYGLIPALSLSGSLEP
jgi:hypothetical protein